MIDADLLLSDAEFDALTPTEQQQYLDVLAAEDDAWTLTPKQEQAEQLANQVDWLLYGGAAGGGKSDWLLWRAHRLSLDVPGHATLMLRSAFPELRRSLIRRSIERFASTPEGKRPTWKASEKEWRYPNGSVIEFGYCESDDDVGQYLSAEYDAIMFDELTEFTEYMFNMIRSRARTTVVKKTAGARPHIVAATNPGRKGHAWVKDLFVIGTGYGDRTRDLAIHLPDGREAHRTVGFVHATVLDNPHIDPAYLESLMSLPENLRRQYLEGDWDVFEGQYFPEFQRAKTELDGTLTPWHVCEPFAIPHEWPRFRAVDYGTYHPFAALWFTCDEDGMVYCYREAYERGMTATEQAQLLKQRSICSTGGVTRAERIDWTVGDPSMWAQREGMAVAAQYAAAGVHLRKGINDRIAGWLRVRDYFRADKDGRPGIRIFNTCRETIRSIPELIHDKNKPEDLDTNGDDHLADCLRYFAMARPRKFVPEKAAVDTSMQARIERDLQRRLRASGRGGRIHPDLGRI